MKIGIIVAMGKELNLLLNQIENKRTETTDGYMFHCGNIGKHEIFAMQCGIGKVNAAIGTYAMIGNYSPELIINTGVAGGADKSVAQMDIVVCEKIAHHDIWCGPGTQYGEAAGCPLFFHSDDAIIKHLHTSAKSALKYGLICSGDKFISKAEEISEIKSHFPDAIAVDMESASIAQVCYMKNVPVLVTRVISDTPGCDNDNAKQYDNFWETAPEHTFKVLTEVLNTI